MTVPIWKPTPLVLIMLQRLWQGAAGVVTIFLMTHLMSSDAQGWYYSFLSFAALYTLFDLGLSLVLVQTAAHLSTNSHWIGGGQLAGPGAEQMRSLIAFGGRHYIHLAIAFIVCVLPAGWIFFSSSNTHVANWQPAWIALAVVTGMSLLPIPIIAIAEGSGDIAAVAGVRLVQSLLGALATWLVLLAGGGLWATVMMPLVSLLVSCGWIINYRSAIVAALGSDRSGVGWRTEIWPLQWRLGLSWLSGYLLTQIQTLILFATTNATVAGQMGLSLALGNMIGIIAQSFIARHVPRMAKAAALRDWETLDRLFAHDFMLSTLLFLGAAAAVLLFDMLLQGTRYETRVLAFLPLFGLFLSLFLGFIQGALAAQLRSYRREPLVWVATTGAILTILVAVPASCIAGAGGIVAVTLAVQIAFTLPLSAILFIRRNRSWRQTECL